jgi:hypothetical protein
VELPKLAIVEGLLWIIMSENEEDPSLTQSALDQLSDPPIFSNGNSTEQLISPPPNPALPIPSNPSNEITLAGDELEKIRELEGALSAARAEKVMFEAQYNSLLGKLTAMRGTLGDKLKSDAVSSVFHLLLRPRDKRFHPGDEGS